MSEFREKVGQGNGQGAPLKRLLTIRQGARYLSIGVWALRQRIAKGQIPTVRDGCRYVRLNIRDLDTWIEDHTERLL